MVDDTLLIDLQRFNSIEVDSIAMTCKVGGGCRLGAVDDEMQRYGLATTFGHAPSTGAGGLILNGGHGHLERVYGLSVDNLIGARVVLASGLVSIGKVRIHTCTQDVSSGCQYVGEGSS